jgi:hypothetical protein
MRDQIALPVTCLDGLYLNGYVPTLQSPGQLVRFYREHLGRPISSRRCSARCTTASSKLCRRSRTSTRCGSFTLARAQRKDDVAAWYRASPVID